MTREKTTVTREFDENGKLITETTETIKESDNCCLYPQLEHSLPVETSYCISGTPHTVANGCSSRVEDHVWPEKNLSNIVANGCSCKP
jgi:hypothetical protein